MAPERPRLLAVDDRPEILRLIERTLDSAYECEFASDVPSARERLSRGDFDVALCDIEMPGGSGVDLAAEILTSEKPTAVVLVTGESDPAVADRAFELGVHGYLVKPFWPGQLRITAMNAVYRQRFELAREEHSRVIERRLQVLMDRAPVPIYMKDAERRYVLANRVVHEIWGIEPYEMLGRRTADLVPPEAERLIAEVDDEILRLGTSSEREETLTIQGVDRTLLTARFPLVDDEGEVTGICGISRDITDRQRAAALQDDLTIAQRRAIDELKASRQETVDRLSRAIERHDVGTGAHIHRMAAVAAFLAERYGLGEERSLLLRAAAPMHDVGKVATPDQILRKPGPLTDAERAEMERHTTVGYEILAGSDSDLLRLAAEVALTHHERWDGTGYPRGLSGEEIPIEGRIVAVADVFDALLSTRSYRDAMPPEQALGIIREGRGSHFEPRLVDLLIDNEEEARALRR